MSSRVVTLIKGPTNIIDKESKFNEEIIKINGILDKIKIFEINFSNRTILFFHDENDTFMEELSECLHKIFRHECFLLKFKNNQLISTLVLTSLKYLINSNTNLNLRYSSFYLLNCLLNQLEHGHYRLENYNWYNQLREFLFQIQKQLIDFVKEKNKPPYVKNEIMTLIDNYLNFLTNFHDTKFKLSFELVKCFIKFIKKNIDESNIDLCLTIMSKTIKKVNLDFCSFSIQTLGKTKYFEISVHFQSFIIFVMINYEKNFIESNDNIIQAFWTNVKLIAMPMWSPGEFCMEIYDRFLLFLSNKIENMSKLEEKEVKYCWNFVMSFLSNTYKESRLFSSRYETLLELMVRILNHSNHLDTNRKAEHDFLKMAYENICLLLDKKVNGIDFQYFYKKYWDMIKDKWLQILLSDKGSMALNLIDCFLNSFDKKDVSQQNQCMSFLNYLYDYINSREKLNVNEIDYIFQSIILRFIDLNKLNDVIGYDGRLSSVIQVYFQIGQRLNLVQWNSSFYCFNTSIVSENQQFILKDDKLNEMFFDLSVKKCNVIELYKLEKDKNEKKIQECDFVYGVSYFILYFLEIYEKKLNAEIKNQLIEFIEYLSSRYYSKHALAYQEEAMKILLS
ncbi:unnamed protein product [Brachionus calyciflorus]|uniref:Uncharacterized protein n=1 Tax=Brachionus calyciflorus TaxID=104777 RepID=A0A813MWL3_9BILA|nr:unnamed protein product [Brachionus calyciflorus]